MCGFEDADENKHEEKDNIRKADQLTRTRTALPALLFHCGYILSQAMVMSIVGGLLIYGTVIAFTAFFQEEEEF